MKKIIVMVDWYAPGFKAGGPIRSCVNLVERLREMAGVSVITRNTDYHEMKGYQGIQPDTWITFDNTRVNYLSKENLGFSSIKELLLSEKPDVLYLNSMFSLYFTIIPFFIAKFSLPQTKVVIAPRGMLAPGALSIKRFKKKIFLSLLKISGTKHIHWHATNKSEVQDILKVFPGSRISVAPNLVSLGKKKIDHISKEKKKLKLISIARISPEKNLLYALEVLREIEMPVEFRIYGAVNDKAYWQQCESIIREMPQHEISHHGSIDPAEIPDALSSAHFLFMPTLGENFGHVIIESFAAGTPVVISDRTPWTNLVQQNVGYDIDLEKRNSFVHTLEDLILMDGPSYELMSKSAFDFAKAYSAEKNELNSYQFLYA